MYDDRFNGAVWDSPMCLRDIFKVEYFKLKLLLLLVFFVTLTKFLNLI